MQCLTVQLFPENCGKLLHLVLSLICGNVEFVCVRMCVHTQFREKESDCLPFKGFVDFCLKISRNLEVKRDYITKMYHF